VSELDVRRAGPADVDEVVAMLSEAARWLLSRGIQQWPDPFPRERVERLVRRGDFYVALLDGEPVATLALQWADPAFWGDQPDDAGYVHGLAVRRTHGGRGLGAMLLDWAEAEVGARGREFLRLDCLAENRALRRYYEEQGFEPRGEVAVDDFVAMRFERRCASETQPDPGGEVDPEPAHTRGRRVRRAGVGSQRERGRPTNPTQEGGGALLG
jgi:ribosomal protein S18 acetylase RimI-like enzyme